MTLEVVATIKGRGHDEPWVVIKGDSVESVWGALDEAHPGLEANTFAELIHRVDAEFKAVGTAVKGLSAPPAQNATPFPAAAQGGGGGAPGPACAHGPRVFVSGTSTKTGKPWKGWDCPAKGSPGACQPERQFVNSR